MGLGRNFKIEYGIRLEDGWSLADASGQRGSAIVVLRFERLMSRIGEELNARLDIGKGILIDPGPPGPPVPRGLLRRVSYDLSRHLSS